MLPFSNSNHLTLMRRLVSILSPQCSAISCNKFLPLSQDDWNKIIQISSQALVLPALYAAINAKGITQSINPAVLRALKFFFELNVQKNTFIRNQVIEVTSALNQQGITPVWLKGATILLDDDWQSSGRQMVDLDLWIPDSLQHSKALGVLSGLGYEPVIVDKVQYPDLENHHHFIPMQRVGSAAPIEVHKQVLSAKFQPLLLDHIILPQVCWMQWQGLNLGILSKPHQVIQSYVQCAEEGPFFWLRTENSCLMKVADLQLRLLSLAPYELAECLSVLSMKPWSKESLSLFSMLQHYFSYTSYLADNSRTFFIQERLFYYLYFPWKKLQRDYPRLMYFFYMAKAAVYSIKAQGFKQVRTWPKKLRHHFQKMKSLH